MADKDPLAGDTGLLDDFDGTVTDAAFLTDANYNQGQTFFLNLVLETDDPDEPETEARFPVGADWASYDGGITVAHPKNKRTFNNQSAIIALFQSAIKAGAENVIRERMAQASPEGHGHKHADIWKGLSFHWNVHSETFKVRDRQSGEMVERTRNTTLPTRFLGVGNSTLSQAAAQAPASSGTSGSTTSGTATTGAGGATQETSENAADDPLSSIPPESAAKVGELAKEMDYTAWIDAVMQLPGVVESRTMMKAISNEGLYTQLRS